MALGFGFGMSRILSAPFTPKSLFSTGAQGVWYDPSDMGTLFQDAAGTTPVTAVEQPVGRMLDKSGRGNHATQTTAASRPVLSARYNLLTETEFRNGVSDAPTRGGLVTASTMTGYAGALAFGNDPGGSYAYKNGVAGGSVQTLSAIVEMADGNPPTFGSSELSSNANTFCIVLNSSVIPPPTYLIDAMGGGRFRVSGTFTAPLSAGNCGIVKYAANQPTRTFKVTAYQLTVANSLPDNRYQRVNTATDYDTVGFRPYLRFDGVDDFLVTPSINFTGTDKMTVFAGVRKLSDAADAALLELSTTPSNNGMFHILAPGSATAARFQFVSRGTAASVPFTGSAAWNAPVSAVVTGIGDISGDVATLRLNGAVAQTVTTDQGAGTYGNYPLYIGRRGGTSLPFNGYLYGMTVVGKTVTSGELYNTETYTNQKTGAY